MLDRSNCPEAPQILSCDNTRTARWGRTVERTAGESAANSHRRHMHTVMLRTARPHNSPLPQLSRPPEQRSRVVAASLVDGPSDRLRAFLAINGADLCRCHIRIAALPRRKRNLRFTADQLARQTWSPRSVALIANHEVAEWGFSRGGAPRVPSTSPVEQQHLPSVPYESAAVSMMRGE